MDKRKRAALEAAGFRIGDAEDFLALTDEERRLVDLRLTVSRVIRRLRERQHLTQQMLAVKLRSSQSRVAKIEAGAADVSLDLLFRGLFAVGGSLDDLAVSAEPAGRKGE
jgi:ribosome-binding protein aMBF1 (putative translation factor)